MNRTKIAKRIKATRIKKGITVKEFCKEIGVKSGSISNIERIAVFSTYRAFKISDKLNVSMDYLLCLKEKEVVKHETITSFLDGQVEEKGVKATIEHLNGNGCKIDYRNFYNFRKGMIKNLENYCSFCRAMGVSCDTFKPIKQTK